MTGAPPSIFTCTTCAAPAVALRPGTAPQMVVGIITSRGEPSEAWCMRHWLHQFGQRGQQDLFGEAQ
ncbi:MULTISPECIES: hypothetical protein [unclassified Acidocella]|uniref:hypothetical protein n=1 Tax=unclassified Acidocella TaxID=2648610 RepID=UPI00028E0C3C|nr:MULTISPECIES: hypothetical protein [unclassified Acidocella]EKN01095.1 hypothetical protein MXAZACID_02279 [Acidocella sp. MX-AZ02]WBO60575.1 hypothetical protein GT370_07330 [Acidocella sp. MX-AZ03]